MFRFSHGLVRNKNDIPKVKHFQAIVFGTNTITEPGYGPPDPPGDIQIDVPSTDVYAFTEQSELESFIEKATRENASFVFYSVSSLGNASVKVMLDI